MSTPGRRPEEADRIDFAAAGSCDVCDERRARWMTTFRGRAFVICNVCRESEPCGRCGIERDACECKAGPEIFVWLPIAGEG